MLFRWRTTDFRPVARVLLWPGTFWVSRLSYRWQTFFGKTLLIVVLVLPHSIYLQELQLHLRQLQRQVDGLDQLGVQIRLLSQFIAARYSVCVDGRAAASPALRPGTPESRTLFAQTTVQDARLRASLSDALAHFNHLAPDTPSLLLCAAYGDIVRALQLNLEHTARLYRIDPGPDLGDLGAMIGRNLPLMLETYTRHLATTDPVPLTSQAVGSYAYLQDSQSRILLGIDQLRRSRMMSRDMEQAWSRLHRALQADARPTSSAGPRPGADEVLDAGFLLWQLTVNEARSWVDLRLHEEARRQRRVQISVLLIGALLIYIAIASTWHIQKALAHLARGTEAFCQGRLDTRIQVRSNDEFGQVANNFNRIADRVQALLLDLERQSNTQRSELERKVLDRTRELQQLNLELNHALLALRETQDELIEREKMASLGKLVAGVAHEVNTPLGLAYTMTTHALEQLEDYARSSHSVVPATRETEDYLSRSRQYLQYAVRNLERATRLISSFKLIAVDQTSDHLQRFRLLDYTQDLIGSLHSILRRNSVSIVLDIEPGLECTSYPGAYSQVLTNLITNAVVHGLQGRTDGFITVSARTLEGERMELTVSDNGTGMAPEVQQRIFEPFFTTRRGQGGSGLGMSIVYNLIVQRLHGTIVCDSAPDAGTRIRMTFPLGPDVRPATDMDIS